MLKPPARLAAVPIALIGGAAIGLLSLIFALPRTGPAAAGRDPAVQGRTPGAIRHIPGPFRAEAIRVVDGDTFEARLRIWFNQDVTVSIRLDGIDAPETRGRCPQETRLAAQARDALADILASGEVVVSDLKADKYNGRAVARATVRQASGAFVDDVAALLLAGGYARSYDGRARAPWCGGTAAFLAEGRPTR